MKKIILTILSLAGLGLSGYAQDSGESIFDNSILHEIRFEFEQSDYWDVLTSNYEDNAESNKDIPYLMGKVIIDGEDVDSVGVRLKGFTSYHKGLNKNPIKIDFNEFVSGQKYDGLRKLNLNNSTGDASFQREPVCYDLLRSVGVKASRTSFAKVFFNDTYWGCYQVIEQVDKEFLKDNFSNSKGNLFKNLGWSHLDWKGNDVTMYDTIFSLKTNEEENDWSGFINFLDVLNNTSDDEFKAAIEQVFNVELFLKTLAVDVATINWDSYLEHGRNYYLYEDTKTGIFHWIPWDYNFALGGELFGGGGFGGGGGTSGCALDAKFVPVYNGTVSIKFLHEGISFPGTTYQWDFGGTGFSTEKDPTHTFPADGKYLVCLTVTDSTCQKVYCDTINTNQNLADCESIRDSTAKHSPGETFARVVSLFPDCCETWGQKCEDFYGFLGDDSGGDGGPGGGGPVGGGGTGDGGTGDGGAGGTGDGGAGFGTGPRASFAIDQRGNMGVLIRRLLNVPEYYQRYLANFCNMVDHHFTTERTFTFIDANKELISDAIESDPNLLSTFDEFLSDIGDDGIKGIISKQVDTLSQQLDSLDACQGGYESIEPMAVAINELVASNDSTSNVADEAGEYDDWVELYNNTDESIDLSNVYLSNNLDYLKKWQFPEGSEIKAQEYLIIWADQDEDQSGLHCGFKLSKDGDEIYLSNDDGSIIDSVSFGEQRTNVAYARIPNGTGRFLQKNATFGRNNEDGTTSTRNRNNLQGLKFFPNPVTYYLNVTVNNDTSSQHTLDIFSVTGQHLLRETISSGGQAKLDVSHLRPGFYLMTVSDQEGNRKTVKFSKIR